MGEYHTNGDSGVNCSGIVRRHIDASVGGQPRSTVSSEFETGADVIPHRINAIYASRTGRKQMTENEIKKSLLSQSRDIESSEQNGEIAEVENTQILFAYPYDTPKFFVEREKMFERWDKDDE